MPADETLGVVWVVAPVLGLIPASIARRKGYSFVVFWLFGAALFIVALPLALVLGPNRDKSRECAACRSWVPIDATVCRHCQRDLPPVSVTRQPVIGPIGVVGLGLLALILVVAITVMVTM